MDWIVIHDVKPYDGRYEFELVDANGELNLTTREWGWIRRYADYHPLTFGEGLRLADAELVTVLAVLALRRAGKIEAAQVSDVFDRLADAPFGSRIVYETDTPAGEQAGEQADPPASSNGSSTSSGDVSRTSSGPSEGATPGVSGGRGSGSSASTLTRSGS